MPGPTRKSELALLIGFLAIIGSVPLVQTGLELARGERVQFTDVLRRSPTASNLRQYEHTLEEKSWFQQTLRPPMQQLLFASLRDTGSKGILGRDGWLFYRSDVRYLVDSDRLESGRADTTWVEPAETVTHRASVEQAIVRFRDQLQERGIALVVMPIPGKPSVYPEQLTRRVSHPDGPFASPTSNLLRALEQRGIPTLDLFTLFARHRRETQDREPLYLSHDTHWTPTGARLAAQALGNSLREHGIAPVPKMEFQTQRATVQRWGDILEMMQIPNLRETFGAQVAECEQVLDPVLGPLLPSASDRPGTYKTPGQPASVLVLGDSFCRIYQYPEPLSLGQIQTNTTSAIRPDTGTKRLLPGSAGFISHLARELRAPVDAIVSDGGASTDVRRKLSINPEILEGKRVVIWEFVERDVALGRQGWEPVPLPKKLD